MIKTKVSWGILLAVGALACTFSSVIMNHVGGIRTVVVLVIVGTFFARYQKDDCRFPVAVRRAILLNQGIVFFLAWFYLGVLFAALRGGMGVLIEWKLHVVSILSLFFGFFLSQNPKYTRFAVYFVGLILIYHALIANVYVTETGMDMREALEDMSGALGHTDYWTIFSMLTIFLLCYILQERNKVVRVVGIVIALYLYKTILLCGFATPVALFLFGHILVGLVRLRYGKVGFVQVMIRLCFAAALIGGGIFAIYKVSTLEDDSRYSSIQVRFKNMLEDPEGGGYAIEDSRFNLAKISWETFKESPYIGCGGTYFNNPKSGGHQALFDYLGIYGLLGGGGAFICFVVLCFINAYRRCSQNRDWISFGAFACTGMYLMVGVVNPGWFGGPLAICLLYAQPFRRPLLANQLPLVPGNRPGFASYRPVPYSPVMRPLSENRG